MDEHEFFCKAADERAAKAESEIERLSLGIHEHTTYPEPLIQENAVDTAIALIRDRKAVILQNRELVSALQHMKMCRDCGEDSWENCEGGREALAAIAKATATEKPKCPCQPPLTNPGCPVHGVTNAPTTEKRVDPTPKEEKSVARCSAAWCSHQHHG